MPKRNKLKNNLKNKIIITLIFVVMLMFSGNVFADEANKDNAKEDLVVTKKVHNLTIFSESNMTFPLVKIARLYSATNNSTVSINFNNSYELIKNIDDGESSDVFIASHPDWIDGLKQKGLVDVYNLANVAKDKLLLITSKKNHKINIAKINQISDTKAILKEINNQQISLIVDSKLTSLGKYTDTILKEKSVSNQRIYHRVLEDKKSIVDFINENDTYCGIVLASSVKNYDDILVLKTIDNSEIYYQALVIAGTNMDKARDFLEFIKSDAAKTVFAENGFIIE